MKWIIYEELQELEDETAPGLNRIGSKIYIWVEKRKIVGMVMERRSKDGRNKAKESVKNKSDPENSRQ